MPFHQVSFGDFEVIAVQAQPNRVIQAANLFPTVDLAEFEAEFVRNPTYFGTNSSELRFTQTICLVRKGAELILIDTGVPFDHEDAMLLGGMREAGITPDLVTLVVLTHRDMDHIGGTMRDGKPAFPKARYIISKCEYEGYKVDTDRSHFPAYIAPLEEAGVLDVVADDAEITPGLRLVLTPGHRPGATSVLVDNRLIALADVWHCPAQVSHPEWKIGFDTDADLAIKTRTNVIEEAEEKSWLVAVPHTPEFGLGRVGRKDGARVWLPAIA